jgi:hypothetical protein
VVSLRSAAEPAVEAIKGDRVELGESQLAEGRLELGLDYRAVVVEGRLVDRTLREEGLPGPMR